MMETGSTSQNTRLTAWTQNFHMQHILSWILLVESTIHRFCWFSVRQTVAYLARLGRLEFGQPSYRRLMGTIAHRAKQGVCLKILLFEKRTRLHSIGPNYVWNIFRGGPARGVDDVEVVMCCQCEEPCIGHRGHVSTGERRG
jgi:hypothetical protein